MRDLDRIKTRKPISVDRQKVSIIFATGIVIGMTIFTVGLYIGLRKPASAEASTVDPLADLIDEGVEPAGADQLLAVPQPGSLRYHELLAGADDGAGSGAADDDVDAPMPVSGDSPIPMSSHDDMSIPGSFYLPSAPSGTAFEEPARIALPKIAGKGVYTVHVNSFSDKNEAAGYVKQLRKAGYKAFLVQASSESRGILYRVRIGPFFSHKEALVFSEAFEAKEGVPTYIVERVLEA